MSSRPKRISSRPSRYEEVAILPTSGASTPPPVDQSIIRDVSSPLSSLGSMSASPEVTRTSVKPEGITRTISESGRGFTKAGLEKKKPGPKAGQERNARRSTSIKSEIDSEEGTEVKSTRTARKEAFKAQEEKKEKKRREESSEEPVVSVKKPKSISSISSQIESEPPRKRPRTTLPPSIPTLAPKIIAPSPSPPPVKKEISKPVLNLSDAASRNALLFGTPIASAAGKPGLPSFSKKKESITQKKPIITKTPLLTKEELAKKLAAKRAAEQQSLRDLQTNSFDLLNPATRMAEFEGELRNHIRSLHAIGAKDFGPALPRLTVFGSVFSLYPRPSDPNVQEKGDKR